MQLCTSCVSLKTKKDRTFQLLLHCLPRAMTMYHAKTINVCRVFLVWATIPKYQRQKLDALVNVALNCRVEDKHKGKITFTGGKHDTGTSIFI